MNGGNRNAPATPPPRHSAPRRAVLIQNAATRAVVPEIRAGRGVAEVVMVYLRSRSSPWPALNAGCPRMPAGKPRRHTVPVRLVFVPIGSGQGGFLIPANERRGDDPQTDGIQHQPQAAEQQG